MTTYRVNTVGEDDQYAGVEVIECDTDDAALARAKQLLDRRAVDVLGRRAPRCEGGPSER